MLWKLEFDEGYFRILDNKKLVAGYFDPDYGDVFPKENAEEIIESMVKNHEKVIGGVIMVPLVKFGLFDSDLDTDLLDVEKNVVRVNTHLQKYAAVPEFPIGTAIVLITTLSAYIGITRFSGKIMINLISATNPK